MFSPAKERKSLIACECAHRNSLDGKIYCIPSSSVTVLSQSLNPSNITCPGEWHRYQSFSVGLWRNGEGSLVSWVQGIWGAFCRYIVNLPCICRMTMTLCTANFSLQWPIMHKSDGGTVLLTQGSPNFLNKGPIYSPSDFSALDCGLYE